MMTKNPHSISGFIIEIKSRFKFVAFYDWPRYFSFSISFSDYR